MDYSPSALPVLGAARGRTSKWDAADEHQVLVGVDRRSVCRVPLEGVVGAGRVASRTHITNDVARFDLTERAEQGQVRVVHEAIFSLDVDPEPAQRAAGDGRDAVEWGEDRRPHCGHDVVALVAMRPATGLVTQVAEVVGDRVRASHWAQGERPDERDLDLDLLDPSAELGDEAPGLGHLTLELLAVHLQASLPQLDDLAGPYDLGLDLREAIGRLPDLAGEHGVPTVQLGQERHPRGGIRRGGRRQHVEDRYTAGHVGLAAALV